MGAQHRSTAGVQQYRQKLKAYWADPSWRQRLLEKRKGRRTCTMKERERISAWAKSLWRDPVHRQKMIALHQGKPHSFESRQKCSASNMKYRTPEEAALHYHFKDIKRKALQKDREFSLTLEQFRALTKAECHYCGIGPSSRFIRGKVFPYEYRYNGIDRVNNSLGYVPENCVPCCWMCNTAKRHFSYELFTAWLDRIAQRRSALE